MNDKQKKVISSTLAQFSPQERGVLEEIARLRVEHKIYEKQLVDLKAAYDSLYTAMITILHAMPDKEIRLHKSQFLRFKAEYRIDQKAEGDEVVLKLLTLTDDVG